MAASKRYHTGRDMITSALYSAGKEGAQAARKLRTTDENLIIADRLNLLLAGIAASPMLREELIACGLSPELIVTGIGYHIEFISRSDDNG